MNSFTFNATALFVKKNSVVQFEFLDKVWIKFQGGIQSHRAAGFSTGILYGKVCRSTYIIMHF